MRLQSGQFFRDVALVGEEADLSNQVLIADRRSGATEQLGDAFADLVAIGSDDQGSPFEDVLATLTQVADE